MFLGFFLQVFNFITLNQWAFGTNNSWINLQTWLSTQGKTHKPLVIVWAGLAACSSRSRSSTKIPSNSGPLPAWFCGGTNTSGWMDNRTTTPKQKMSTICNSQWFIFIMKHKTYNHNNRHSDKNNNCQTKQKQKKNCLILTLNKQQKLERHYFLGERFIQKLILY